MTDQVFHVEHSLSRHWFDFNGHLNVVGYLHYFVETVNAYFSHIGFGADTIESEGSSFFALQQHLSYLAEIRDGSIIRVVPRLIDTDGKRLYFCVLMYRGDGVLAATLEQIAIHVDFASRIPSQMAKDREDMLRAEIAKVSHIELPDTIGRTISMRRG